MKRYGNLYEKIYDINNLRLAHLNARRGKTHYAEVKKVDKDTDKYLLKLQEILKAETFKNSKYNIFEKVDKGKQRTIYVLPYFPDRILHHAIMQVLEPIWKKVLIRDTYQSIKGRGTSDARRRVRKGIKSGKAKYCLKFDIKKYYPSINNNVLMMLIKKKIKCQKTLKLLSEIIYSSKGVPIGNYLSQYFGNLYLTYFDHYVKENLRVKRYFRYCDDIVILENFKKKLHRTFKSITNYLKKNLQLVIKRNYQIFPVNARGIDFCGYRFFEKITLLRTSIVKRFKKKIRCIEKNYNNMTRIAILSGIASYWGWLKPIRHALYNKYVINNLKINKIYENTIARTA